MEEVLETESKAQKELRDSKTRLEIKVKEAEELVECLRLEAEENEESTKQLRSKMERLQEELETAEDEVEKVRLWVAKGRKVV